MLPTHSMYTCSGVALSHPFHHALGTKHAGHVKPPRARFGAILRILDVHDAFLKKVDARRCKRLEWRSGGPVWRKSSNHPPKGTRPYFRTLNRRLRVSRLIWSFVTSASL